MSNHSILDSEYIKAAAKQRLGTIMLALAKPLDRASRRKLLNLPHEDKLTIACHPFPQAALQILINKNGKGSKGRKEK